MGGRGGGGGGTSLASRADDARAENEIKAAYRKVADRPGQFISLTDVRENLSGGMSRQDQDDTLRRLQREGKISLAPQDYQSTLTAKDKAAAVMFGGRKNHLIWIGDPSPVSVPKR